MAPAASSVASPAVNQYPARTSTSRLQVKRLQFQSCPEPGCNCLVKEPTMIPDRLCRCRAMDGSLHDARSMLTTGQNDPGKTAQCFPMFSRARAFGDFSVDIEYLAVQYDGVQ